MSELISSVIVVLLAVSLTVALVRKYSNFERRFILVSFVAHVFAAIAQVIIARGIYNGGDNLVYMSEGSLLARAIEYHPERFLRIWLTLLLQRESNEVIPFLGEGSSTGTMVAITAVLAILFRYSLYSACLATASLAFFGKIAIYRTFKDLFPQYQLRLLIAVFAMPSLVFWSAGIQKEAFVIAGIGPVWLGVHWILRGRFIKGALVATLGFVPILFLKPYTIFALSIAVGSWIGLGRLRLRQGGTGPIRVRPLYILLAAAVSVGGVVLLGQLYPDYSFNKIGEDLAHRQQVGAMMTANMDSQGGGGSYYAIGTESVSLQKQIAFAPLAVATALFRPFPFEANNSLAFVASLEVLALTIIVIQMLFRVGPRLLLRRLMSSPALIAALVFTLLFGVGVGLATTNFGSLSRYRMPLVPFYSTVVLILGAKVNAKVAAKSPLPQSPTTPRLPRASTTPLLVRRRTSAATNVTRALARRS